MAERRMFAKTIIDSDAFLDMPSTAQLLYFHLAMRADDDGFINKPKSIMRITGCKDDDMKLLIAKKFIIPFETGIVVISHWKIHNYIRNDRYKETTYKDEKAMLSLDENNAYTLGIPSVNQMDTNGIPMVSKMDTQDRIGKDSIDKDITMCNAHVQNTQKDAQSDMQCTVENSSTEINALFESLWELYPNKKGKGRISKTKKKEIYKIGFDEFKRCIDRYVNDLKKDTWRKPQNGNTFFSSGYIDYLDKNYVEDERAVKNDKYGDIGTIL